MEEAEEHLPPPAGGVSSASNGSSVEGASEGQHPLEAPSSHEEPGEGSGGLSGLGTAGLLAKDGEAIFLGDNKQLEQLDQRGGGDVEHRGGLGGR